MLVTYFAHDLSDPAVVRRVRMLRTGGADIRLAGFRRSREPVVEIDGTPALDLGRTFDGRLCARAALVARRCLEFPRLRSLVHQADVLLARNLEMCMIAGVARTYARSEASLVYECLDIHKMVQGDGWGARALRSLERRILSRSSVLIVSSPGYIKQYFKVRHGENVPRIILAENKLILDDGARPPPAPGDIRPPWKIGWFAKCQCVVSFHLLLELARRLPAIVEIEMRGSPTAEVQALIDQHLPLRNMRFLGRYQPSELALIYRSCHFTWTLDFNGGLQSYWLLPNRVYEGGFHNVPAIAADKTETAAWLKTRGSGVVLREPYVDSLKEFFGGLCPSTYRALCSRSAAIPTADLAWSREDCRDFVRDIMGGLNRVKVHDLPPARSDREINEAGRRK